MTYGFRRAFVALIGVLAFGAVALGCSSGSGTAGTVGTGGSERAFLGIQVTPSLSLAIENRAGLPLTDVNIAIRPVTGDALYTTTLSRMEPGEKRDLQFGTFKRKDGTPLSSVLGFVKPKEISATGVDAGGAKHEITVPWKS
jgi:hypothetical protein